jgi:hypothetical protein
MPDNKGMTEWWDNLTVGEQMGYWNEFKAEGDPTNKVLERAYKQYLKTFKLRVVQ